MIIGDANMSEISTYLKVGTTALVLAMIEANFLADDLAIAQPVRELHDGLARPVAAPRASRSPTAARSPRSTCRASTSTGPASSSTTAWATTPTSRPRDVLDRWESVLTRLADDPMLLRPRARLGGQAARCSRATATATGSTGTPRGCSWSTCSTPTSVRRRACTTGSSSRGRDATRCWPRTPRPRPSATPPEDTRAYFRGECLRRYGPSVAAASWDSVIFDVGRESLVRVPMLEPERGTRAHVGELLDRCATAADLIEALNAGR